MGSTILKLTNLPMKTSSTEILRIFYPISVSGLHIGDTEAFVTFRTREDARQAMQKCTVTRFRGRELKTSLSSFLEKKYILNNAKQKHSLAKKIHDFCGGNANICVLMANLPSIHKKTSIRNFFYPLKISTTNTKVFVDKKTGTTKAIVRLSSTNDQQEAIKYDGKILEGYRISVSDVPNQVN